MEIFNLREGGLAIYGGIIGGFLGILALCKFKKYNFLGVLDCIAPGVMIGQLIGRWGNFTNGEAFGYETDIFCRMGLKNTLTGYETVFVHPTFLYESLSVQFHSACAKSKLLSDIPFVHLKNRSPYSPSPNSP